LYFSYGDRAPKSFWARMLAIANMLCGFVLMSLITANISSDFVVTTVMAGKKSLYMTKVKVTTTTKHVVGLSGLSVNLV
jgi:predicted signal transduction protein with EAL and GGDEF domain